MRRRLAAGVVVFATLVFLPAGIKGCNTWESVPAGALGHVPSTPVAGR